MKLPDGMHYRYSQDGAITSRSTYTAGTITGGRSRSSTDAWLNSDPYYLFDSGIVREAASFPAVLHGQ